MVKMVWSGLLTVLLLSGCGWDGTATRPNDITTLTSIKIIAVAPTIANGTSTKLSVIGDFAGLYTRDITDQAVWSSDNTAVAGFVTASSPNRVSGVSPGSAVLKAAVGSVTTTYTLTVSSAMIQAIAITPPATTVPSGFNTQFTASGTFMDGTTITTQDLTFDAIWTSGTPAVASVSNDPVSKGLAKGLSIGSASITATFGTVSSLPPATLNVTAAVLKSIAVTPANTSIVGFSKTVNFIATGTYSDGTTADISTTASWSSSVTGVASIVASSGVATTVAVGTTIVSATLNGVIGITNLTVTAPVLIANGLTITPVSPIVPVGGTVQLTVTATFNDTSTLDVSNSSVWTSATPSIASVISNTGLITGVSAGTATITAQYGGQSVTKIVTVQ